MRDETNITTGSYASGTFTTNCQREVQKEPCPFCSGPLPSGATTANMASDTCNVILSKYFPASRTGGATGTPRPNAYFALRAGAVCTAMQKCSNCLPAAPSRP